MASREQKRNPRPLHDVIYDMYMQKYGNYEVSQGKYDADRWTGHSEF